MKKYTERQINELIDKFEKGILTEEEMAALNEWYEIMGSGDGEFKAYESTIEQFKERLYRNITNELSLTKEPQQSKLRWRHLTVAASILVVCSIAFYFFQYQETGSGVVRTVPQDEISAMPGGYKAILTLADGKKIRLTSGNAGEVSNARGIVVTKSAKGQLVYRVTGEQESSNGMNTIETPAGGQYEIILPDRSSVTLNALSSLTFPERFSSNERKVVLVGEGYFKVSKNRSKPFKVSANGQEVEVLGTQFNLNSYRDEPNVVTTLEEGSVRVSTKGGSSVIAPGQQAVTNNSGSTTIKKANMSESLAWRNGEMIFEDADLQTIMRQVSRWYNVKVSYEGNININRITGSIGRDANLKTLIRILKGNGIKIRMEETAHEKTLVITE